MANTNIQYETLYGISLLDDLHNYFPAILYDSGRFHTVPQLLHYIQTSARGRFDLFSFGQRNYLNTTLESQPVAGSQVNVPFHNPGASPSSFAPRRARDDDDTHDDTTRRGAVFASEPRISAHIDILQEDLGFDNQALSLMNLLNVLTGVPGLGRGARVGGLPNAFLEPVVVRPSAEQIERGTTRAFPPEDTVCAICQDGIPVNQMARRLNACGHTFHISCIDQWYQRDVRCPTCRHDVRESSSGQPSQDNGNDADTEGEGEEVN